MRWVDICEVPTTTLREGKLYMYRNYHSYYKKGGLLFLTDLKPFRYFMHGYYESDKSLIILTSNKKIYIDVDFVTLTFYTRLFYLTKIRKR